MPATLGDILAQCPEWFHSIEVAPGLVTPGTKTPAILQKELGLLRLPDLRGRSVLDIGAYDGFFSFSAERLGAARIVSLDHYVWSTDMAGYMADWRACRQSGQVLPPPHQSAHWDPAGLPGRRPFDLARRMLGSRVDPRVGDFMTMDLTALGTFDVVLFLGVLYHLEHPLLALQRLRALTAPGGLAILETEALEIPGSGARAYCEFFPGMELNNDPSNWWSPNRRALEGLCRAAGFREVEVVPDRPLTSARTLWNPLRLLRGAVSGFPPFRYRAYVHAWA